MKSRFLSTLLLSLLAMTTTDLNAQTLEVTPEQCRIFTNSNTCETDVSWSSSWPSTEIWLTNADGSNPRIHAAGANGNTRPTWIREYPGVKFNLKHNGQYVRTVHAWGERIQPGGTNFGWYDVDPVWVTQSNGNQYFGAFGDYVVVKNYHKPGVRSTVQNQLDVMWGNGIRALRLFVWHARNNNNGLVFDSSFKPHQKKVAYYPAQVYQNLRNLLGDIESAGFDTVYLAMGPLGQNDYHHHCSSLTTAQLDSLVDENYGMIRETQIALNSYPGLETYIDLHNEYIPFNGAHPCRFERTQEIWNRYVAEFGAEGSVGFSVILGSEFDAQNRFTNLPQIFGNHAPARFEVHTYVTDSAAAIAAYQAAAEIQRDTFPAHLRDVPWVIGETDYNQASTADTLHEAVRVSGAPVDLLLQWPNYRDAQGRKINIIPLEFDEYISEGF